MLFDERCVVSSTTISEPAGTLPTFIPYNSSDDLVASTAC